jgi:dTDP-4-amino-4,6-dideoxygalactose transaminase
MSQASVPFLDLTAQFDELREEWLDTIRQTGATGAFILGPNVAAFEREFAAYTGSQHAVALANGTDALVLSLRALGIGPGDEVITTPYTFFASAEAITIVGATPVFVDIEPAGFNLDPRGIAAAVTARTRAVLPVHIFGYPSDMTAIQALAKEHNLDIVEDCAQACGAEWNGGRVGSQGIAGTFSFYPTKILGCYGDGGMVTTNDAGLEQRLRKLRNHGAVSPFIHDEVAYNSRLDEIQAALLRIKLRVVEEAIRARREVADWYQHQFAGTEVVAPPQPDNGRHVFNLYTIRVPERDLVRERLAGAGIGFSVCYPQPLHLQPVYYELGYRQGQLPQSELAATQCISLPVYPGMREDQVDRVCEVVLDTVSS